MVIILISLAFIFAGLFYFLAQHEPQPVRLPIRTRESTLRRNRMRGS